MLKILWKRREIAPEEQFFLLSTIFSYLMLDFYVKTRIKFSLRDERLFEIIEVEITRVDCTCINISETSVVSTPSQSSKIFARSFSPYSERASMTSNEIAESHCLF